MGRLVRRAAPYIRGSVGAVIARGQDYRETFQVFAPGFDLTVERQKRAEAGNPELFNEEDLYPDVRPTFDKLRQSGLWLGIAGNQTARAGGILRSLQLPVDMIATSDDWGVEKPNLNFFAAIERAAPCPAADILYVGDRLDNDVIPARIHGFKTALIRRGPWGIIQQYDPIARTAATIHIDSLAELPVTIDVLNSSGH